MNKPRLYFETSALSRLIDEKAAHTVGRERHAAQGLLGLLRQGRVEGFSSDWALEELRRLPSAVRKTLLAAVRPWLKVLPIGPDDVARAELLAAGNFSRDDALHVALAERIRAQVLLTADARMVMAARCARIVTVDVANLFEWLQESFHDEDRQEDREEDRQQDREGDSEE